MFEQEIEMEKRQSSVVPLLLIVGMIVITVGVAAYYVIENRKVMSKQEATTIATEILKAQGPATVTFHTGLIKETYDESARDVRYRILEKLGVVKIGRPKGIRTPVELTAKGEDLLKQIPGVKQSKEENGTETYVVPLAERQLAAINAITMTATGRATVEYTWQWVTNQLGKDFDASGPAVKSFNTWDRATLIDKHGANFYQDGTKKVIIAVVRSDRGWQLATD